MLYQCRLSPPLPETLQLQGGVCYVFNILLAAETAIMPTVAPVKFRNMSEEFSEAQTSLWEGQFKEAMWSYSELLLRKGGARTIFFFLNFSQ